MDRIIVAGGGGGDGDGLNRMKYDPPKLRGGDGGGTTGGTSYRQSGTVPKEYGELNSNGGSQASGGKNTIYTSKENIKNENGKIGVGGRCSGGLLYCGGGGGGYYGGGGGYDATGGGGGSGFVNTSFIFGGKIMRSDHVGNGLILFTPLFTFTSNCICNRKLYIFLFQILSS